MLRDEFERRLGETLGGEVRVQSVTVSLGLLSLRLSGSDVEAWPGPDGPDLRIARAVVELRPFAHLTGQRRLARISLERPRLRLRRDRAGHWSPALPAFGPPDATPAAGKVNPDEILRPLIALEATARALLGGALPASQVEVRDAVIELIGPAAGRSAPKGVEWRIAEASVWRRPFLGETVLALFARLVDRRGDRGGVALDGRLGGGGAMRLAAATTDLDLAVATAVPGLAAGPRAKGKVSGVAIFEAPSPGSGRLELDLVGRDVADARTDGPSWLGPLRGGRVAVGGVLEIDPQQVQLHDAHLASERAVLRAEGSVERPLERGSRARISLALEDAPLEEARQILAWLPEVEREEANALLANLESGQLRHLEVGGEAALGEWVEFLTGRSRSVPRQFALLADLDAFRLRSGDDRIEELGGHLAWTGDRVEVRDLHATLDARPLPMLDLEVDGISSFFATDPALRRLTRSAPPLAGLGALWKDLQPDADDPPREPLRLSVGLEIDRLEHPMFLWPIEHLAAEVTPIEHGVRVGARDGRWGGVPVELAADWLFEPQERVVAHVIAGAGASPATATPDAGSPFPVPPGPGPAPAALAAGAPPPATGVLPAGDAWAQGRVSLGPIDAKRWKQRSATARFEARGAVLRLDDGHIELAPHGRAQANFRVDLSRAEQAPFQLSFEIFDGDLPTVGLSVKLPAEIASGRVDAGGTLDGRFDPAEDLSASLEGLIDVDARDGRLRKDVPAVMAIALASDVLAPLSRREWVRFDQLRSLLSLGGGWLDSPSLTLDGPDARAFASGKVSIGEPPHQLDVELVLFLFRNVDRVLDKIPIVNFVLLGPNRNLVAAHYALAGSLEQPKASLVPLDTLTAGPGTLVFEGLPSIVTRGLAALGGLLGREGAPAPGAADAAKEALPPRES